MNNYLDAEYIKGKRTFSHFFPTLFPLLVVLLCVQFSRVQFFDIRFFVSVVYYWWPLFFLPTGLAVLGYQTIQREKESHAQNYYYLLNQPIFWKTKIIILSIYSFIANLSLAILTLLLAYVIYNPGNTIIMDVILTSLVLFVSTLFIIPFSILLAQLTSPILPIMLNILGIIMALFTARTAYWFVNPWGWSLRLIAPIIKVNPNGALLKESDPLNDFSVLPLGICLAIFIFIILYIITPKILYRNSGGD